MDKREEITIKIISEKTIANYINKSIKPYHKHNFVYSGYMYNTNIKKTYNLKICKVRYCNKEKLEETKLSKKEMNKLFGI